MMGSRSYWSGCLFCLSLLCRGCVPAVGKGHMRPLAGIKNSSKPLASTSVLKVSVWRLKAASVNYGAVVLLCQQVGPGNDDALYAGLYGLQAVLYFGYHAA